MLIRHVNRKHERPECPFCQPAVSKEYQKAKNAKKDLKAELGSTMATEPDGQASVCKTD